MKCRNIGLGRKCKIKERGYKYTSDKNARKMLHLLDCKELIIVDKCSKNDIVFVKENIRDLHFYMIHRKDLKKVS